MFFSSRCSIFINKLTLDSLALSKKFQSLNHIQRSLNSTTPIQKPINKSYFQVDKKGIKKYSFIQYEDGKYYKPCICFDLETTGLDFKKDKILEVSLLMTDRNLDVIPHGSYDANIAIVPNDLFLMDEWVEKTHTDSGLLHECLSIRAKTLEEVDEELYNHTKQFLSDKEKGVLLGNSVSFDRYFVNEYLPKFSSLLSHKVIDVTGLLELKARTKPEMHIIYRKSAHRAKSDVSDSLRVARNFKYNVFDKSE